MYYLRDRKGKSARIAEKIKKKIGIDVTVKPEAVTQINEEVVKNDEVLQKKETAKDNLEKK